MIGKVEETAQRAGADVILQEDDTPHSPYSIMTSCRSGPLQTGPRPLSVGVDMKQKIIRDKDAKVV